MERAKELRERADLYMLYSMGYAQLICVNPRVAGFLLADCWIAQLEAEEAEETDDGTRERTS